MGCRSACTLIVLVTLLVAIAAKSRHVEPEPAAAARRRLASAGDTTKCPRAALYIVPALPNVRDAATFQLVRTIYIDTVKRLAPAGAISDVIPTLTEPNTVKGSILVHTTVLFSGSCEAGKAAARTLHVKLLGDVRTMFYVPAPRAKSLFGDVYMVTVSHPFLADGTGAKLVAPTAPAGTDLAAQFSITWEDTPPSKIGELQAAAFKAAILKQLPAGAGVYFTTMITEGVSYRFGNHWRANAAPVSPTVAKSAGKTSQGGVVWPPGQPTDVKAGRLVFNTNIHGIVFNTAAGKAALTQFMQLLRSNTAAVFPPRTFGRMALDPGYGLRLVNQPAYPCTCEVVPPPQPTPAPKLTLAQAYGPTSATATASGAANVTLVSWEFTATPASGTGITQKADAPLVWWYGLKPDKAYTVSVVGITAAGKRVPGANTLAIRTPKAGAPTVAVATATSSTQVTVRLSPPTTNLAVSQYTVFLCLKAQPTKCVNQTSTSTQLSFANLTPGAVYIVSATAKIGSTVVPASNTLPLAMPQRGAPILLTAVATGGLTGAATAAAPGGASFSKYVFTAVSPSGAPTVTSTVTDPLKGRFTGLRPATQYDVTVVAYTGTTPSPTSNMLSFVTPAANAPLNTGTPQSPTLVLVKVVPPTLPPVKGGSWVEFDVTLCPIAGPQSACATKRVGSTGRRLLAVPDTALFNAVPGTTYNSVTVAFSQSGEPSKQSMPAQVTTPTAIPWSVSLNRSSVTQTSAAFKISPPSEGGPYTTYVLSVCPKPASGAPNWDACPKVNCLATQLASCNVSGLAAGTAYVVSGVASNAYGVTSIRSSAAGVTTLPWPAPTIGEVVPGSADLSTATVSITRPDLVPPTGWSQYNLTVCAISPAGACTYPTCTPVRAPPTPTSCALTGLRQGTTYRVTARAVQGSAASAASASKSFKTLVQDAPTLVSVSPSGANSGLACLKAPAVGGPWTGLQCQSCYNGSCKQAPKCSLDPKRRLLDISCQDSIACQLGTLESSTTYSVVCVGISATDSVSGPSNKVDFTTQDAVPPVLTITYPASNPGTIQCNAPPVGTWEKCVLDICTIPKSWMKQECVDPKIECSFDQSGVAVCSTVGIVQQQTNYTGSARAVRSNGMMSDAANVTYILPYYPKPTISSVTKTGNTYSVTVVPDTSAGFASYPPGGWTAIEVVAELYVDEFTDFPECKAPTDANGVPQTVTCQKDISLNRPTDIYFFALAVTGPRGSAKRVVTNISDKYRYRYAA